MKDKEIRKLVSGLSEVEFRFLYHLVDIVAAMKKVYDCCSKDRDKFCRLMKVERKNFNRYLTGNYEYKVYDLALIENAMIKLEEEKLKDSIRITVDTDEKPSDKNKKQ